jgi:hypothetical protein
MQRLDKLDAAAVRCRLDADTAAFEGDDFGRIDGLGCPSAGIRRRRHHDSHVASPKRCACDVASRCCRARRLWRTRCGNHHDGRGNNGSETEQ